MSRLMTTSRRSWISDITSPHRYIIRVMMYWIDPPREHYMDRFVTVINGSLCDDGVVVL